MYVLDAILRMLHPFMPFLTEEIWQKIPLKRLTGSVMVASFPEANEEFDDIRVADEMELVIELITAIRNIRGEMNVPPGEQIEVILRPKGEEVGNRIQRNQSFIRNLARLKELRIGKEFKRPSYSAFAQGRDVEIFVPMDRSRMEEEAKRLHKEISKVEKDIAFVNRKISNEQFLSKAPPDVVHQEKEKSTEYCLLKEKLEENLRRVKEALG